ncbi:MAG: hypothetical protein PGN11_13690 [Quadrisphaera sp.]
MSPGLSGLLLGVDVGGSKTAVAVADAGGRVLFSSRGPGGSPDELTDPGCLDVVQATLTAAGAPTSGYAVAALAVAGVDQPDEEQALAAVARERGLVVGPDEGGVLSVVNDLFAVLRSAADTDGSAGARGIAVIAGTGTNAVGLDGERTVRFLSLGPVSGDWGGGADLGVAALGAACREEDGRGPSDGADGCRAAALRDGERARGCARAAPGAGGSRFRAPPGQGGAGRGPTPGTPWQWSWCAAWRARWPTSPPPRPPGWATRCTNCRWCWAEGCCTPGRRG